MINFALGILIALAVVTVVVMLGGWLASLWVMHDISGFWIHNRRYRDWREARELRKYNPRAYRSRPGEPDE